MNKAHTSRPSWINDYVYVNKYGIPVCDSSQEDQSRKIQEWYKSDIYSSNGQGRYALRALPSLKDVWNEEERLKKYSTIKQKNYGTKTKVGKDPLGKSIERAGNATTCATSGENFSDQMERACKW